MAYRNDQYYGLKSAGESGSTTVDGSPVFNPTANADNPPFKYPERVVRTTDSRGKLTSTPLKRGYIRTLTTNAGLVSVPIKKCAFQFNPSSITQSVSQNDSMLNFLQQDPAQYAQPMPGNVNFSFELWFDRSYELNNPRTNSADPVNVWEKSDPSQVGVLRDIAAFYAVIGQGLSEYQQTYMRQVLEQTVTLEANRLNEGGDTEAVNDAGTAIGNIDRFLEWNIGNSAFLLPMPVRVVFSGLYMVEGLVTNSTVIIPKFSTNMVPMQAKLNISMEAKYIGFAKKDTFFTYVLEEKKKAELAQLKEVSEKKQSVVSSLAATANTARINPGVVVQDLAVPGSSFQVTTNLTLPNATSNDKIDDLYDDGISLSLDMRSTWALYGPFDSVPARADLRNLIDGRTALFAGEINAGGSRSSVSDLSSWKEFRKKGASQQQPTYLTTSFGDITTKKFIVFYYVRITAKYDNEVIVGEGENWSVLDYNDSIDKRVSVLWPDIATFEETRTSSSVNSQPVSVPASNAATSTPRPGTVSTVGSGIKSPTTVRIS